MLRFCLFVETNGEQIERFWVFKVSKYESMHTCQKNMRKQDHKQAKSWIIAKLIQSNYQDVSHADRPKKIIQDFRKEFGINLSYERARKAQEAIW